ncbi:MAG TPA: hypothetical protein VGB57_12390 [Allosphingosinicella sp.]
MSVKDISQVRQKLVDAGYDADLLAAFSEPQALDGGASEPDSGPELSRELLTAALGGHYSPGPSTGPGRYAKEHLLDQLLSLSETLLSGSKRVWRLRTDVRRQALMRAHRSGELLGAVQAIVPAQDDIAGRILRNVLAGGRIDLDQLPRDEFDALAQVIDWLSGTPFESGLPDVAEVRRVQQRRELIEPFLTLVGRSSDTPQDASRDRFVGREREVERLRAYVGIVPPDKLVDQVKRGLSSLWASVSPGAHSNDPLRIEGTGGSGKSTLVAKFILDHALIPGVRLPFAYLDFDRATIAPREPLQLLIDIALQLSVWVPEAGESLRLLRHELRDRIEQQAQSREHKDRERQTRSELRGLCRRLKESVESVNAGKAPVLLLLDTFEIVQYDREAIDGVQALIGAMREPEDGPWTNLRVVVAGRGKLSEIRSVQRPLPVGRLSVRATEQLIARRNELDELGLSEAVVAALARPLSESPLDVITITRWLEQNRDKAADFTADLLADPELTEGAASDVMDARVSALLIDRMIKHIADKRVRSLALPGFVIRAISPAAIAEVMMPAARAKAGSGDTWANRDQGADELFNRLARERWLVYRQGPVLRHRAEVRRAMLRLMRQRDPDAFYSTNDKAIEFFRARAEGDRIARAEAIYHLLLARQPKLEAAEELWRSDVGPVLAGAVDDLQGAAANYLRVKLGRAHGIDELEALPAFVLRSIFASGPALLRRLAPDDCLQLLADRPDAAEQAVTAGVQAEALYRGGHWAELVSTTASDFHGIVGRGIEQAANGGPVHPTFRAIVLLSTRDSSFDVYWVEWASALRGMLERTTGPFFWEAAALLACLERREPQAPETRVFDVVAQRCRERSSRGDDWEGNAALRVLAMLEPGGETSILRRVDLKSHLATVNLIELSLFREMLDRAQAANESTPVAERSVVVIHAIGTGRNILAQSDSKNAGKIILDPQFTSGSGAVAQGLLEAIPDTVANPVRQMLAISHPDWVEPLGLALDRAYGGAVPTRLGWFTSVETLLGSERGGGRHWKTTSGHQILSLADEAGQLLQAVSAYREHMISRVDDPSGFPYLAERLEQWAALLSPHASA